MEGETKIDQRYYGESSSNSASHGAISSSSRQDYGSNYRGSREAASTSGFGRGRYDNVDGRHGRREYDQQGFGGDGYVADDRNYASSRADGYSQQQQHDPTLEYSRGRGRTSSRFDSHHDGNYDNYRSATSGGGRYDHRGGNEAYDRRGKGDNFSASLPESVLFQPPPPPPPSSSNQSHSYGGYHQQSGGSTSGHRQHHSSGYRNY